MPASGFMSVNSVTFCWCRCQETAAFFARMGACRAHPSSHKVVHQIVVAPESVATDSKNTGLELTFGG